MPEPIVINFVSSRKEFTTQLLDNCYFYEMDSDTYDLFSAANLPLKKGLQTDDFFDFELGPFKFTVTGFKISKTGGPAGKGAAHGNWEANILRLLPIRVPGPGDADDEGSFQAQAGGHGGGLEQGAAAGSSR